MWIQAKNLPSFFASIQARASSMTSLAGRWTSASPTRSKRLRSNLSK
jgi:hypothetical protein